MFLSNSLDMMKNLHLVTLWKNPKTFPRSIAFIIFGIFQNKKVVWMRSNFERFQLALLPDEPNSKSILDLSIEWWNIGMLVWPQWGIFVDVSQQGVDFSKKNQKNKNNFLIWHSQMFTWIVKKCQNLTFKVKFLRQKSSESFSILYPPLY